MKKHILSLLLLMSLTGFSQKYVSSQSEVTFFSTSPIEDIEAKNTGGKSVFNLSTGDIVFAIPISSFRFDKSLMEEHFNEKYMESDKYPKSVFKGKVTGFDIEKEGVQKVNVKGKVTIHGVEKPIDAEGEMSNNNGKIVINHSFKVALKDYKIKIPQLLWQNIAEVIDVKIIFTYKAYEK